MTIIIYTDGSCINNGKKNAVGAIGIYYGDNNPKNLGMAITDENTKITNQTMELLACIEGLSNIESNDIIYLYTDSQYVIKSMTEWIKKWELNGWIGTNKKPIENLEIIKSLNDIIKTKKVIFKHIRSHQEPPNDITSLEYKHWYGNKMADELATTACKEYLETLKNKQLDNEDDDNQEVKKKKIVKRKKKLNIDETKLENNI